MQQIILSDTSCLILLDKIGKLELLHQTFGTITVTKEVVLEFGKELPDWIIQKAPSGNSYRKILDASLDPGEASTIALALELDDPLLIIDDLKGRRFAKQLGLQCTGTIGVLIEAKRKGRIKNLKDTLEDIGKTDFRISDDLINKALKLAGE